MSKNNEGAKSKKSNRDILSLRKKKTGTYVVFNEGVEITFKGEKLDLGEYRTAKVKTRDEVKESNAFYVEKGYITQEQADQRNEMLDTKEIAAIVALPLAE